MIRLIEELDLSAPLTSRAPFSAFDIQRGDSLAVP